MYSILAVIYSDSSSTSIQLAQRAGLCACCINKEKLFKQIFTLLGKIFESCRGLVKNRDLSLQSLKQFCAHSTVVCNIGQLVANRCGSTGAEIPKMELEGT